MNVKALRERAGLSQSALADKLGVSKNSVSNWEQDVVAPRGNSLRVLRDFETFLDTCDSQIVPQSARSCVSFLVPTVVDPRMTATRAAFDGSRADEEADLIAERDALRETLRVARGAAAKFVVEVSECA